MRIILQLLSLTFSAQAATYYFNCTATSDWYGDLHGLEKIEFQYLPSNESIVFSHSPWVYESALQFKVIYQSDFLVAAISSIADPQHRTQTFLEIEDLEKNQGIMRAGDKLDVGMGKYLEAQFTCQRLIQ